MVRWRACLLSIGILVSQDDGLPPNFIYLEPIEDFYGGDPITLEIIITDRNKIEQVSLFYRFHDNIEFIQREMQVSYQPVIYNVEIPIDEVKSGSIQYYFWAKDEYNNGTTWPIGGEDMPMVLPVYPTMQVQEKKEEIPGKVEGIQSPEKLEDNLPYYLEIGMLTPFVEINQEEGVPIIVLSVYDTEEIVELESVKLLIDGEGVISFNSPDMITYIPTDPFDPGYHIVRYETNDKAGEKFYKEFSFFMHERILDGSEIKKVAWKDKINFKGDFGWNTDYDPSPKRPIDTHKINSAVKFQLGDYKFKLSGLMNTHIIDLNAREEAKRRQPSTRLKFIMQSPYVDFNYGDNSPEFSDFSLKGTRVRGVSTKLKWGTWETSFVSGETKHWIDSDLSVDQISSWNMGLLYKAGNQVYDEGSTWIAITDNSANKPCEFNADTCAVNENWIIATESEFTDISNDFCTAVEPAMYGLNPDTSRIGIVISEPKLGNGGGFFWFWDGSSCKEELIYSSINMLTGEDGIATGELFNTYDACRYSCTAPVQYEKGSQIRYLQGFRTSNDFFEHAKFGVSAIRSWDLRDETLIPYSELDDYPYEGNIAAATDFSFHFNHDKTVLSGEYGLSITMDQTLSDDYIINSVHGIDISRLYSSTVWDNVDYCFQNQCIDINGDGDTTSTPQFLEGIIISDTTLWEDITNTRKKLKKYSNILGLSLNDDINGYAEGRGISGLNGPEVGRLIDGGLDSLHLLLEKPAFKVVFKTPIPLYFTELNFQTEFNQAPLNYLSHGSSSIQTDVRNWKNKVGFKIWKSQMAFTFGYDNQIKSPWDPENEGEIKRSITNTKSGSIGLSFRNLPGLNYSIRLQDRQDLLVNKSPDGVSNSDTTGLKQLSTHTIAPTYKLNLGKTSINLNGNITLVNDLDILTDTTGCYEILNSTKGEQWGGVRDTNICGIDENIFIFEGKNKYPFNNSGTQTSTYTGALSFSFSNPLSLNLGWGMSTNSPNDFRQSETVITVFSTKVGYKLFDKKLNITIGGNYVIGNKGGNGFWDSGEEFTADWNQNEKFDLKSYDEYDDLDFNNTWTEGVDTLKVDYNDNDLYDVYEADTFIDKVELNNAKLTLKSGFQYKMPEQKITIGLNLDYTKAVDNLKTEQDEPAFKAKLAIKYGF